VSTEKKKQTGQWRMPGKKSGYGYIRKPYDERYQTNARWRKMVWDLFEGKDDTFEEGASDAPMASDTDDRSDDE